MSERGLRIAAMDRIVHTAQRWGASYGTVLSRVDPVELLFGIASSIIIAALIQFVDLLYRLLHRAFKQIRKMQVDNTRTFPFEALPQELRDMVYSNLLEDVHYPPPAEDQPAPTLNGMLSGLWGSTTTTRHSTKAPTSSNWIILANKQIHAEYVDLLCMRGTFHLSVTPENYLPPTKDDRIWNIAPTTLKRIRKASLEIVTTSAMLGWTDPRNMESSSWDLAARIRSELSQLESCTHLTLNAKAIGDPLWNPLWIWYHSSQSFKNIGTALADCPTGPKLDKITFSLDTWSPGENYLKRDETNKGAWSWYCLEGHNVGLDGGPEQTVREFCGMLYRECATCHPIEDGGDEEA